jgi:hypothetical protein
VSAKQQPMAASTPEISEPVAPSPTAAPAATATATAEPAAPSHPATLDISPRAAAFTLATAQLPSACNPHNSATSDRCEAPHDAQATAQAELTHALQQAAHDVPHLAKREPPELHREADGSFRFTGPVFSAHIALDGQVAFEDKAGVRLGKGASLGFDLNDAVESALGHELYSAEKHWFLDQTVAVREKLADTFRVTELARAQRSLERALERIVDSADDVPHKHAAVFALWQDCDDDADAGSVRHVVEAFVRAHMPEGSALGFDAAELERLNAERSGMRHFDPYRAVDAGSPG